MTDAHAGKFSDGGIVSNAAEAVQFLLGLMQDNGRGDSTMDIRAGEAATQLFCAALR